jgi:cellulose synthase operon protein C
LEVADQHTEHRQAPQSLYNAAFAALELRRLDQCVELSARFLAEHPEDPLAADAMLLAVEANLDKRDFAAAQRHLETLIAGYSDRPERDSWRLRLGLIRYVAGQYGEALKHLRATLPDLEVPEQVAEAQYLIGACHFFQEDFPAARMALEASLKANSSWRQADEATLLLARSHQKESQWQKALETLAQFPRQYPRSAIHDQAYYRQGEIHYTLEHFSDAIRSYQQVVDLKGKSTFAPYALYGMGWSHLKLKHYSEASQSFAQLLTRYPNHELTGSSRLAAGMALRQEGKLSEAIAELQKFLATNPPQPQRADALYERGLAEVAQNNHAKASTTFVEILTANAAYAHLDKVRYELAWAYRNGNEPDQALAQFVRLAKDFPESPLAAEANFHLAEDLYQKEHFSEAVTPFRLARQGATLSELKEKATYKLGWTYFQLKQYDEAVKEFSDQAASFPDGVLTGDALFMQAESLFQQGKYEPALAAFQLARQTKPSSEQMEILTLMHAGQSASQLKEFRMAVEFFDQLESQYPKSAPMVEALYERGWARQNLQELDQALSDYERAAAPRDALGARARFMMGQIRFTQKNHGEAIREFQRAMFLYGGEDAPAEIRNWQVKAAYEAGRCAEVQIQSSASGEQRAAAIGNAKKFYQFVVQNGADEQLTATAQKRLDVLAKL